MTLAFTRITIRYEDWTEIDISKQEFMEKMYDSLKFESPKTVRSEMPMHDNP